jgi:hypothetical protein
MKLWLMNPRFETSRRPTNNPQEAGVVRVVVDCPCGCARPFALPPIPGSFEPNPLAPPQTQLQWRQLLNGCTYPGDTFRVIDSPANPCGWIGLIRLGRVFTLDDVETDVPLGTRVAETLQRIRERQVAQNGAAQGVNRGR